ncbi:hypothetical protein ElyMa_003199700 [Elysia marginata]|uniref:Transposase n=1 Tax=Elysia marginata TaxID=1093978 RepID=A0AAV4J3R5_9GAST|nr:hypothetical protein ElyMa_003199700 [Elysia marginata]
MLASDTRTVNAMRVTAGITACGQRKPVCSTRSLRQISPGRWEDPDPQQPEDVRMPGRTHLTRTAKYEIDRVLEI